ncbi:MAG: glycosyl transferase family 1 [Rhodospirillaceae bacterium]|nr:glycosyl transferase family 1 [Rhodospirillaceae bacterium]|tara:strand:- start:16 stop:1128 length:1113 start_codon:yes stop_codon:yes gene_type:complete
MKIAFYAPMKAPSHRVPSGDRTVAQLLMTALRHAGHEVTLASTLRSWDRGDAARQKRLADKGSAEARRLCETWRNDRPDLWFTYHLYHKAPDHLGPHVATALNLPYVVAEPSISRKQRHGAWADGFARSLAALARADALLPMTGDDRSGLLDAGVPAERVFPIPPFIDTGPYRRSRAAARRNLADRYGLDPERPVAVTVAMMREGDKMASYQVLAEAMAGIDNDALQLLIVGDGPCCNEVEALFGERACFAGRVSPRSLPGLLAGCDLFVWPAVNEAYGMAILAAQAAGLPVIAGDTRGVPDVVENRRTGLLTPVGDAGAIIRALTDLLADPQRLAAMGAAAADRVSRKHSLDAACAVLDQALDTARRAR